MAFVNGHALLIGVGSFEHHSNMDVDITVNDARAIQKILHDSDYCGYPKEQVHLLTHEKATKSGVEQALLNLADQVDPDSTVFLFLCSHGAFGTDGRWYFNTHDVRYTQNRVQPESSLSEARLIDLLRNIKAQRLFVVFNTCFSGSISPTLSGGEEDDQSVKTKNPTADGVEALLATGTGRIIITASGEDQYSFFTRGESTTIFTQALLNALKGRGVQNRNGYVSAFDLYTSVYDHVKDEVHRKYDKTQHPELTVLKGVGPFAVSLYRGVSTLGDFQADAVPPETGRVRELEEADVNRAVHAVLGDQAQMFLAGGDINTVNQQGAINTNIQNSGSGNVTIGNITHNEHVNTDGGAFIDGDLHTGDGPTALGRNSQAVGGRGVSIGGNANGPIITGDNNQFTTYGGDHIDMSGDFRGALVNVKSTLTNVTQTLGALPPAQADEAEKLKQLVNRLEQEIGRVGEQHAAELEKLAKRVERLVDELPENDADINESNGNLLQKAADKIAGVLPTVAKIATEIVTIAIAIA